MTRLGSVIASTAMAAWLALGLWAAAAGPARAADDALAGLAGRWRGAAAEAGEVRAEIAAGGGAVEVRWTTLDGAEATARLEPSSRPGVLAPAEKGRQGGFMSALGRGGRGEAAGPLAGEPLLWGRRDGRGLYLYRLEIAGEGRVTLDRYGFEPGADGGVAFAASRVGPAGEVVREVRAALARDGAGR